MIKKLKNAEIKIIGALDWRRFRDLLVEKFKECNNEEELSDVINILLASMFKNSKEIDQARKQAKIELLSKEEKNKIDRIMK